MAERMFQLAEQQRATRADLEALVARLVESLEAIQADVHDLRRIVETAIKDDKKDR